MLAFCRRVLSPRVRGLTFFFVFISTIPGFSEAFKNPQWIKTSSDPLSMDEGDLNGDGQRDLVYLAQFADGQHLEVLLNQGGGQFTSGQDLALPANLGGLVRLADVNGDGKLDAVVVMSNPIQQQLQVGVAAGNGDGTFQSFLISLLPDSTSVFPSDVEVADLRGHGIQDLIFTDSTSGLVLVCFGDGAGHYVLSSTITNGSGPKEISVGDFNRDGSEDLIVRGARGANATVYLNEGDGTFAPGVVYNGPDHINSLIVKDVDEDGQPDMVVTDFGNKIDVLHGNPDGTFAFTVSAPITVGADGMFPVIADINDYNGDGILDFALESLDGIHILLGKGLLEFQTPLPPAPVASLPGAPVVGDLNQDGLLDFAFPIGGGIAVLYGQAGGSLHSADAYEVGYVVSSAAMSDLNRDGNPDFAVAVDAIYPRILIGKPDGTFTLLPDTNAASDGVNAENSVGVGDFNGDGVPDLLLSESPILPASFPGTSYQLGKGDGTFGAIAQVLDYTDSNGFVAGDLNNDGLSDIIVDLPSTGDVLLAQRSGGFRKVSTLPQAPFEGGYNPAFGDFNRDGKLDFAWVGNNELQVYLGNGDGTFRQGFGYLEGNDSFLPPGGVLVVDLDGDGNLDIAATPGNQVQVFYGRGDGTFDPPQFFPIVAQTGPWACCTSGLAAADFNKDGFLDLAIGSGNAIYILHGAGRRSFGAQTDYLAGDAPAFPIVGDFNHDGYPDIAVANSDSNLASTVTVLLNIPDPDEVGGSLTATPEPSSFGSPFTITLVLKTAVAGAAAPTGNVSFSLDGENIGTAEVSKSTASLTVTSSVPSGPHTISGAYSGDKTYHPATFSVIHAVVSMTQTGLTIAPNPAVYGDPVALTATVTSAGGVPGGAVNFLDGSANIGSGTLNNGSASLSISTLQAGMHSITAAYSASSGFGSSSSPPVALQIVPAATTITITANPQTAGIGSTVTFIASVSSTVIASGTVNFLDGATVMGSGTLDSGGHATFAIDSLSLGAHSISASYLPSTNFSGSTSTAITVNILPYAGDFSISVSPASRSVYTGEATRIDALLSPSGGWNQPVALSCSGLPANTTCAFAPAIVPGASGSSTVTIQTSAPHQAWKETSANHPFGIGETGTLAALALLIFPTRHRRRTTFLSLALALIAGGLLSGCGAPGPVTGGTPPGTYKVITTATFSQGGQIVTHSSVVQLTVKSLF